MQILYNVLVIPFLYVLFHISALFNEKIRRGVTGRIDLLHKIRDDISSETRQKVWFHIASYGEFEQAKPVMRQLKQQTPDIFILVSFFSPSGYDHIKAEYPVDYTCFLPFDTLYNAHKFLSLTKPAIGVIVRHDIWPNFLWAMKRKRIPALLLDASIPAHSSRLWPILRHFHRQLYDLFDMLLVISTDEISRLRLIVTDSSKLVVTGDTKFDQVQQRTTETSKLQNLLDNRSLMSRKIFIAGSSWPSDEVYIIPAYKKVKEQVKDALLILVPHEPSIHRIKEIETMLQMHDLTFIKYSTLAHDDHDYDVLIVDKIGLLANLYRLGMAAFVGGSFTQKVHNVLEPAAHGIPVIVGPKISSQAEAVHLAASGGAVIVNSSEELVTLLLRLVNDEDYRSEIGRLAKSFVGKHLGATQKTVDIIQNYLSRLRFAPLE